VRGEPPGERLPAHPAQRIDRTRPIVFSFAGRRVTGFAGDTIGSALYAAGVRIFSRSFKYHRPRGLFCCRGHCPTCLVNVDGVPNVRACTEPLRSGQVVTSQHAWPSVEHDALALLDRLHFLFPVGFYYKTFIHPRRLWPLYERVLRSFAGLGRITFAEEPPGEYERAYMHTDVAVIGGGLAGLAAAREAARAGARIVLLEAEPELGGRWRLETRAEGADDRPRPGYEIARELAAQVTADDRVRVLTGATAFGLYEDGLLGVLERHRFVKLRASQVVVATGAVEQPLVFENNDLPGVMLGGAARRLAGLYGIRPGRRAVVVGNDDRGPGLALDLQAVGVEVVALADTRPASDSALLAQVRERGTRVLDGHTVVAAQGRGRVSRAALGARDGGAVREFECDLICLATGREPAAGLIGQAGGHLAPGTDGRRVPGEVPPGVIAAGEVLGLEDAAPVIASGRLAGARAALALSPGSGSLAARVSELSAEVAERARPAPPRPRPRVRRPPGAVAKAFVCLCEDVTEKDLVQAVAEGFDHVETLKRYTTVTMGPCQGKMCLRAAVELCADLTGRSLDATGTPTARPPAEPVPLGALAARLHDPVKLTPMHDLHVADRAELMDMGRWKRPLAYGQRAAGAGRPGHDPRVDAECRAVHEAVGVIDVSTLGKLEVVGRDAAGFLDWLHPNRFSDLKAGRVRYRVMCDEAGIILDDGVVARLAEDRFFLTTGTGTIDAIEQWFEWWLAGTDRCCHVVNLTGALGAINVAGPRARDLLAPLTDVDLAPGAFPYLGARRGLVAGVPSTILRIGFVGELGFEVHFPADYGEYLWTLLLEAGTRLGAKAFGVEAQRVLRLEKQHVIVAQDTDALTSPFGANLGALVKLDKPDFIGRDALAAAGSRPPPERLVGFELDGPTPPGEGAAVVEDGRPVGRVTSAKWSAWLGRVIGLAWVAAEQARPDQTLRVRVDGDLATARVRLEPFYDPEGTRLRS
jgi:sarcosine oxidase subunit alpha